ncbi:hypothetical protein Q9Q99_17615 [Curtobacterium flaccumfaciens]|nr:hypothetical protein Q9Q99_17615 [Curtobacterium flaccumfaciens]
MSTIAAALAATPSPSPSVVPDVDVTPGCRRVHRDRARRHRDDPARRRHDPAHPPDPATAPRCGSGSEAEANGTAGDGTATDEPERRAAEDGRADVGDDT